MNNNSNNIVSKQPDWYQKVLGQALAPMTLRVGCFSLNKASRFDLYGKKDGFLQNIILEVGAYVRQLSKQSIASNIYSGEAPIIRFISHQAMDISSLENVQIENMTIAMADSPEPSVSEIAEESMNYNNPQTASINYSAEVIGTTKHSDFIFGQILCHSDLLVIDAGESDNATINEFVSQNLSMSVSTCVVIVRNNRMADFIASGNIKIDHNLSGEILNQKLKQELSEILLFNSLLEARGVKNTNQSPALLRIADYAEEISLEYQKVDPDFEYQGPISNQNSWISWHNIFRRFVNWLSPKSNFIVKTTSKSEQKQDSERNRGLDNLKVQKDSENCHKLYAHFLRADQLAIRYANAHRSSFILIYCLGAFALINAAIAIGFSGIGWLALTSALAEFFALAGIFIIYKNDHKKRYHIKWLEYRSLAEMLRMAPLLNSLGISQSARGFDRHRNKHESDVGIATGFGTGPVTTHNAGRIWLIIYTESLMRWVGFERIKIDNKNILSAKSFLRENILKGQLKYHQNNAQNMHVVGHNLGHFSYVLFVLAFIFVSGKLLTKLLAALHLGIDYEMLSHIGHGLGVLAAICPMLGSAAFAIRNHAEFDISSQRSLAMLKSLKQDVEVLDKMGETTNYQELVEQTIDTSLVMQAETADWLEIYEVKETEPG